MSNNITNLTIGELLTNYPPDGINVSITFTRQDLADLMSLWISLDDSDERLSILDHIITQIHHKKAKVNDN